MAMIYERFAVMLIHAVLRFGGKFCVRKRAGKGFFHNDLKLEKAPDVMSEWTIFTDEMQISCNSALSW